MKKTKRILINIFLAIGLILSISLTVKAFYINEWNTIAATLAVITAIIGTFLSLKIVWKQEDEFEPEILVLFDVDSRSGVIQLVIKNIGGSNAYDIKLKWNKTLKDAKDKEVVLPYVPVLTKGDSIKLIIDSTKDRLQKSETENLELVYGGIVEYKYSKKDKKYRNENFEISLEHFKNKIRPITDQQDFYLKNSGLHESLKEIDKTLKKLTDKIFENE